MVTESGPEPELADAELPDNPVPALVQAAAAGDSHAWEQLVDRYQSLLWSICRSYRLSAEDSADVVQLTWLRLLDNPDVFFRFDIVEVIFPKAAKKPTDIRIIPNAFDLSEPYLY